MVNAYLTFSARLLVCVRRNQSTRDKVLVDGKAPQSDGLMCHPKSEAN